MRANLQVLYELGDLSLDGQNTGGEISPPLDLPDEEHGLGQPESPKLLLEADENSPAP
jgi:hypothetical protein